MKKQMLQIAFLAVLFASGMLMAQANDASVNPEIREAIQKASRAGYVNGDKMLLDVKTKVQTGKDFIALSRAIQMESARGRLYAFYIECAAFTNLHIDDVAKLSRITQNAFSLRMILVGGAKRIAKTPQDFRILANCAIDDYTKREIKGYAYEKLGDSAMMVAEGVPSVSKEQRNRIAAFTQAVATRQNMEKAYESLSQEDLSIDVVKQSVRTYREMKKFADLHQEPRF